MRPTFPWSLQGDEEKAEKLYMPTQLRWKTADDVAEAVFWAATLPRTSTSTGWKSCRLLRRLDRCQFTGPSNTVRSPAGIRLQGRCYPGQSVRRDGP